MAVAVSAGLREACGPWGLPRGAGIGPGLLRHESDTPAWAMEAHSEVSGALLLGGGGLELDPSNAGSVGECKEERPLGATLHRALKAGQPGTVAPR